MAYLLVATGPETDDVLQNAAKEVESRGLNLVFFQCLTDIAHAQDSLRGNVAGILYDNAVRMGPSRQFLDSAYLKGIARGVARDARAGKILTDPVRAKRRQEDAKSAVVRRFLHPTNFQKSLSINIPQAVVAASSADLLHMVRTQFTGYSKLVAACNLSPQENPVVEERMNTARGLLNTLLMEAWHTSVSMRRMQVVPAPDDIATFLELPGELPLPFAEPATAVNEQSSADTIPADNNLAKLLEKEIAELLNNAHKIRVQKEARKQGEPTLVHL